MMQDEEKNFSMKYFHCHASSSLFIRPYKRLFSKGLYGTRSSTVLIFNDNNELTMSEKTFYADGNTAPTLNTIHL